MSEFFVYPAIDLRFGRVVRLRQGKGDQQTVFGDNPKAVAEDWIEQGAEWLHVVNLNGAFGEETAQNEAAIEEILDVGKGQVKIQLGGGIRSIEEIETALALGIARIVLGTSVIENPAFGKVVLNRFGGEKIAFGFDAQGQELMSRGWQAPSGLRMTTLGEELVRAGAETLIYTNIKYDGMQTGVDWENAKQLARVLQEQTGLEVVLWDERFSTEEARKVLRGQRTNKSDIDKVAAVIILQSYLDFSRRNG